MFLFHMYAALTVVSGELFLSTSLGTSFSKGRRVCSGCDEVSASSLCIVGHRWVLFRGWYGVYSDGFCVVIHGRVFSANQRMYVLDVWIPFLSATCAVKRKWFYMQAPKRKEKIWKRLLNHIKKKREEKIIWRKKGAENKRTWTPSSPKGTIHTCAVRFGIFCFVFPLLFYVHILLYYLRVVGELSRLNRQQNISKILQLHASIVVLQNQISQLPCRIHNSTSNAKKLLTIEKNMNAKKMTLRKVFLSKRI